MVASANVAKKILLEKGNYLELTNGQKTALAIAFAKKGKAIHKKTFDLIHIKSTINFSDEKDIVKKLMK